MYSYWPPAPVPLDELVDRRSSLVLATHLVEWCQLRFGPVAEDEPKCVGLVVAHDRAVRDSKVAPFRLYDLRHTWATRAVEAGIDLVILAAMLGHSKINMVLRYAHPTQEHQTKAMEKLEQFVTQQQIEATARLQGISELGIQ